MGYNRILVIEEKSMSLVTRAVIKHLEDRQVYVVKIGADTHELERELPLPHFVLVQPDVARDENEKFFSALRNKVMAAGSEFIILGTADEIDDMTAGLSPTLIKKAYVRPFDVATVSTEISEMIEVSIAGETQRHIMIVDDSAQVLRDVSAMLSGRYKVTASNSATNAFGKITKDRPDLILLDYEMPICNGAQFMEMLKAELPTSTIPIVFLTSKCDQETVAKLLALHPEGYLLKTSSSDKVINTIESVLKK